MHSLPLPLTEHPAFKQLQPRGAEREGCAPWLVLLEGGPGAFRYGYVTKKKIKKKNKAQNALSSGLQYVCLYEEFKQRME